MDATSQTADEIRRQMQFARQRVRAEVDEVVDGARQFADWRYYPRRFPWATLGAAALLGFAAVPRRLEVISPDVETLQKLARQHKLVVDPKPSGAQKPGLIDSLLTMTGNLLLRAGIAYAGQQVGKLFGDTAAQAGEARA
jgi:hypothetical protein